MILSNELQLIGATFEVAGAGLIIWMSLSSSLFDEMDQNINMNAAISLNKFVDGIYGFSGIAFGFLFQLFANFVNQNTSVSTEFGLLSVILASLIFYLFYKCTHRRLLANLIIIYAFRKHKLNSEDKLNNALTAINVGFAAEILSLDDEMLAQENAKMHPENATHYHHFLVEKMLPKYFNITYEQFSSKVDPHIPRKIINLLLKKTIYEKAQERQKH